MSCALYYPVVVRHMVKVSVERSPSSWGAISAMAQFLFVCLCCVVERQEK